MARGVNRFYLIGTLAATPEMRYTPGGLPILEILLAGNDLIRDETGVTRELPWYHRVKFLGKQAEMWVDELKVGQPLFIEGYLEYRTWEVEGQKKSTVDIRGVFLDPLTSSPHMETVEDGKGQPRLRGALNQVILLGNVTRDIELRYTPNNVPVIRFTLAVNEKIAKPQQNTEVTEKTLFIDVQAWRGLAEWGSEIRKGEPILVFGRLVNDSWVTNTGEKRFATRVEANRLERLSPRGAKEVVGVGRSAKAVGAEDMASVFPPEEDLPF